VNITKEHKNQLGSPLVPNLNELLEMKEDQDEQTIRAGDLVEYLTIMGMAGRDEKRGIVTEVFADGQIAFETQLGDTIPKELCATLLARIVDGKLKKLKKPRYYATLEDYTMDKSMNIKIKIETLSQCIDKVTKEAEKEARASIGRIYGQKTRKSRKK